MISNPSISHLAKGKVIDVVERPLLELDRKYELFEAL
jgi:hypothetical protein